MPTSMDLVDASWLVSKLGQPDVKVLDGSCYLPTQGRDGFAEFQKFRVPGARFFDVNGIADHSTNLPHMLPSDAAFSAAMDCLSIKAEDTVIVYDGMGCFSAPRVWWTLKAFGHDRVAVLDGGLPAYKAAGGEVEETIMEQEAVQEAARLARACAPGARLGAYPARLNLTKVRSLDAMLVNTTMAGPTQEQVVDARSLGRFVGTEPEPRAGLKGGHIPGSRNLPFPQVLEQGGRLKSASALHEVFTAAGIDLQKPLVATCGSGLTACILALAAHRATRGEGGVIPIFDGSWTQWGATEGVPVATTEV